MNNPAQKAYGSVEEEGRGSSKEDLEAAVSTKKLIRIVLIALSRLFLKKATEAYS